MSDAFSTEPTFGDLSIKSMYPAVFAYAIIMQMAGQQPPFSVWRPEGVVIPVEADAWMEVCVWAYQLTILFDLLEAKFGNESRRILQEYFFIVLDRKKPPRSGEFRRYMEAIRSGRRRHVENPLTPPIRPDRETPVELDIAAELLRASGEPQEKTQAVLFDLGHSLMNGRASALHFFRGMIAELEFRPDTLWGLEPPNSQEPST